jgi:hypothetical protein
VECGILLVYCVYFWPVSSLRLIQSIYNPKRSLFALAAPQRNATSTQHESEESNSQFGTFKYQCVILDVRARYRSSDLDQHRTGLTSLGSLSKSTCGWSIAWRSHSVENGRKVMKIIQLCDCVLVRSTSDIKNSKNTGPPSRCRL